MERYRKGDVLGEGTYGKVVKAEETATGKVVAIKKVRSRGKMKGSGKPLAAVSVIVLLEGE